MQRFRAKPAQLTKMQPRCDAAWNRRVLIDFSTPDNPSTNAREIRDNGRVSGQGSDASGAQPISFGPFLLDRRLAVGGSAEVYIARPKMGEHPAPCFIVKRLLMQEGREGAYEALEREAELHQAVQHPNVVTVFGAGQVDGETYLAMEYVEGVDLYRLLRRAETEQRRIPPDLAAYIVLRVAEALVAVHSATDAFGFPLGLVHRDVTPSNVYLSNEGVVKLGDFGIARVTEPRARPLQPTVGLRGKFGYLSPEQIAGEPFDNRADLFALAVILGEMLIGERVFPGSGQLAVLLAIRDGNIEPLRKHEAELPPPLYQVCIKGLSHNPATRFSNATEFAAALLPLIKASHAEIARELATWVRWAGDSVQLAERLQGQIRDSVERMRAVKGINLTTDVTDLMDAREIARPADDPPATERVPAKVRFTDGRILADIALARLIEMIVVGDVRGDDEVALMGQDFRPIREIESLARHLLPSTTATTGRLFEVGIPDYQASIRDFPMLQILARLRSNVETGALFVERRDRTGLPRRKEIYLKNGRLLHVASTERDELLGEYLVRRGSLVRKELEAALLKLSEEGARLGDTLVAMGLVNALDVFRAIRDQGRDRVAALCAWSRGTATFYRGTAPSRVEFPLDLDLASPMMAGAFVASQGDPRTLMPSGDAHVTPGPRAPAMASKRERGTAPIALLHLQRLATMGRTVNECVADIVATPPPHGMRSITDREACAALYVGKVLGWVSF
jgi:serine/threonine protein kinase